tara:strand:+ start:490 stop:1242 length:753 start_codon:yes stop_codon:yes gene_type:complete
MEPNKNLRISTMTLISEISSNINLNELYKKLEISDIFRFVEFGENPIKGEPTKKVKNPRKKIVKKFFYNQLTVHIFKDKIINTKIFNNGRIQMTGLKKKQQGIDALNLLIKFINELSIEDKENIVDNTELKIIDSNIVLINSDFDIQFRINREILHRLIIQMGLYSSYEPCMYPGVNIKYYYNENSNMDGICKCLGKCNGKGNDCCKKITIAVFNSGKIIITGGQSYNHLNTAYDFINKVINENKSELLI